MFVLNARDGSGLAFAAASLAAAEGLCRTGWFRQAVDRFLAAHAATPMALDVVFRARPATGSEAARYRQVAEEFADRPDGLFIAHLGGQRAAAMSRMR